jgi:hypothetical protein
MSNKEPTNALAKAGERFTPKAIAALRRRGVVLNPLRSDVQPKSDTKHGKWMCADCGAVFDNNMQMWGHPKRHRIGWWTGTQLEEP